MRKENIFKLAADYKVMMEEDKKGITGLTKGLEIYLEMEMLNLNVEETKRTRFEKKVKKSKNEPWKDVQNIFKWLRKLIDET